MIYFDNAATTYPKPESVIASVANAMRVYGANPGRAGHSMAYSTAELIYDTRKKACEMFGTDDPMNVIFTPNCTFALNCAIKGLAKKNSHFIISSLEHNAVVRPLETLKNRGVCDYSIARVEKYDGETYMNFERLIRDNTVAVICTGASNVFGKIPPIKGLSALCKKHGLKFIVDGAQISGVFDIDCKRDGIDILCVAAHKGLYAPMASGMMIINGSLALDTIIEGGTGSYSAMLSQPQNLPERFESGTLSVPLIAGINAGMKFIKRAGTKKIRSHETAVMKKISTELKAMKNVITYTDFESEYENFAPLVSFNVKGKNSEEIGALLNEKGIAVRAGLHCAVLAHKTYGTEDTGTVRAAPSFFTNMNDVNLLLNSVFEIAKS